MQPSVKPLYIIDQTPHSHSARLPSDWLPSELSKHTTAYGMCPTQYQYAYGIIPDYEPLLTDTDSDGIPDCMDFCPDDPENECFNDIWQWLKGWIFGDGIEFYINACDIELGPCSINTCDKCWECGVAKGNVGTCGSGKPIQIDVEDGNDDESDHDGEAEGSGRKGG